MSFLYPAFLIGAVAIALPIVLHFLKRDEAPSVPFSAVRLLRRSPVDRAPRRRLRDMLLLAARIAALLLLAGAFARPYVQGAAPSPLHLIAIDRSYSMGGEARFSRARDLAREAIDAAPAGARVAVVAFDERVETIAEPGTAAAARASLAQVTPGYGTTQYRAVLDAIRELAGGASGTLVVVTDLQQSGWDAENRPVMPAEWTVAVKDIGPVPANVAILAVASSQDRLVATLRNASQEPRQGRVRAIVDAKEVSGTAYALAGFETRDVPLPWSMPAASAVTVAIDDPGGLVPDNERYVVLGAGRIPKALVLASGDRPGLYVSRALQTSAGEEGAIEAEVVAGARVSTMTVDELSGYAVIALLSTRGLDHKGREMLATQVREGAGLLVTASPDVEIDVLRAMADWQPRLEIVLQPDQVLTLTATDPRHPIFRPFGALAATLGQVRFERSWRVAPDGWSVIARFSNGSAALVERTLGRGRVVLLASDLERRWNDLPLHPGFVPLALETIRYASGGRAPIREYRAGHAPDRQEQAPGLYGAAGRVMAVNVDAKEGVSPRMSSEAFVKMVQQSSSPPPGTNTAARAQQTEARQSYWQYGLLVMIAALVAESVVGRW
jgi:hypothetical protein